MKEFVSRITLAVLCLPHMFYAPAVVAEEQLTEKTDSASITDTKSETTKSETSEDVKQSLDPDKKAAIEELFEITQIDKRVEDMKTAVFARADRIFQLRTLEDLKREKQSRDISDDDLKKMAKAESDALSSSFDKQFNQKIDLANLVKETAFKLYAKYFTTAELNDIINFYKTPTGAKARRIMPKLARESLVITQSQLRPVLTTIIKQTLKERSNSGITNDEATTGANANIDDSSSSKKVKESSK